MNQHTLGIAGSGSEHGVGLPCSTMVDQYATFVPTPRDLPCASIRHWYDANFLRGYADGLVLRQGFLHTCPAGIPVNVHFEAATGTEQHAWLTNTRQPIRSLIFKPGDMASTGLITQVRTPSPCFPACAGAACRHWQVLADAPMPVCEA